MFCTNCGIQVPVKANFCQSCGSQVFGETRIQPENLKNDISQNEGGSSEANETGTIRPKIAPVFTDEEKNKGFLVKLWIGFYPLGPVFWLGYIVPMALISIVDQLFIASGYYEDLSNFAALTIMALVIIIYYFFISVATWRSAKFRSKTIFWSNVTKTLIIIYWIFGLIGIAISWSNVS